MKNLRILIFALFLIIFFSLTVFSQSIEKDIVSSIDKELNDFKSTLPDYVVDFFPEGLLDGDFSSLINNEVNEKTFVDTIVSYLLSGLDTVLKNFSSILLLIIIISIFNALKNSFSDTNIGNSFSICSTLCISITVFQICVNLANNANSYIKLLCNTMNSFAPIMTAMMLLGGQTSSAVVLNTSMVLFISLTDAFLLSFMLPLIKMCLSFGCVKSLGSSCDFSGISKTVKTAFVSVTGFVMSVFIFVLSYKSTLSQSADTISLKTARFAISSLAPIVGSSINDSLRTVTSSLTLIKNSCGVIAIIVIAVMMMPIIINLFLNKLSFSLLSSLCKIVGSEKEGAIIEEADSVCGFLLTLVCCTCVLFIFALTIFIKTNAGTIS